MRLHFVSATRDALAQFLASSPLARSLRLLGEAGPLYLTVFERNLLPLGECYNRAIQKAAPEDLLVFVHDDVSIDDWLIHSRLLDAMRQFDVVGVAGNRRRQKGQETWCLPPCRGLTPLPEPDMPHLSGVIMHGLDDQRRASVYGPTPAPVRLIDGVFMAARAARLQNSGVRFDPSLGFHLYDLDFCRSAEQAGLTIGTWPIAISHASAGASMHTEAWRRSSELYLRKYNELD